MAAEILNSFLPFTRSVGLETAAGERTPHKSTPLRAAPYFRPDPIHGSPSRSPLANSGLNVLSLAAKNVKPNMAI